MGTLNLTLPDGRSGSVQVGDDFAGLDADKQAATIADIKSALAPHNSFSADLQGGLHDLGTSVSQGLGVAGGVMSRNGMPEYGANVSGAGAWVKDHTANAPDGPAPSEQLAGALKAGDYSSALSALPHAALRGAVSAAPVIAAGALGGPVAAGAMAGATSIGPEAYARAANNGRSEPTSADDLAALPGAAGQALGGALVPGSSKFASPAVRGVYRLGSEAVGGGIMDASGQLGASVGTAKGAQYDPYQTAGAALTQGAIGAARGVPEAGKAVLGGASDAIMSRTAVDAPTSDDQAQSQSRVGQLYQDAQAANPNDSPTKTLNALKVEVARRTNQIAIGLFKKGLIDKDLFSSTQRVINDQALRHNNTVLTGGDGGAGMLMDDLTSSGVDPGILKPLVSGIQDLDTLSPTSFLKNQTGPFRSLAGAVGNVAGAAATVGLGGHLVAKLAAPLGGAVDSLAGLATPKILLQSQAANRYLKAKSLEAGPNTLDALQGARQSIENYQPPVSDPAPKANPAFRMPNPINPPDAANPAPAFIRPDTSMPAPNQAPAFIRPDTVAPTAPVSGNPAQEAVARSQLSRIKAQAQALMATQGSTGPDPTTGLPSSPIPVNTPTMLDVPKAPSVPALPPLRVDTASTVRDAMAQADQQLAPNAVATSPTGPAQRLQAAQATLQAAQPTGPSGPPPGTFTPASGYLARNYPGMDHAGAVAMTQRAELAGVVPPGTTDLVNTSKAGLDAKAYLEPIKAHARGQWTAGSPDQPTIQSPVRYQAAVDKYHMHVMNDVARLKQAGQPDVANAMLDIAINQHTKAAKQAARAALPPAVASQIPDYVVNQGG